MPKLSFIIPIHNTRESLPRCLDSALGQTLHDIELICVNDRSPDDSPALLHEYERNDSRIRVINMDRNRGVSTARNTGMRAASGEYTAFLDSDDCLEPGFCEKLYAAAISADADIVKGNYAYAHGKINFALNGAIRREKSNFYTQLCSAIYRTDFLRRHGITFPAHLIASEDLVFAFTAANLANKIALVDEARIRINTRPGSASFSPLSLAALTSHYQAFEIMLETAVARGTGRESFAYVMASLFALFFQIAGKSRDPGIHAFAAEQSMRLYEAVRAAPRFDGPLFKKALEERDKMLHTCLEERSMDTFSRAFAAMHTDRCRMLRSRMR